MALSLFQELAGETESLRTETSEIKELAKPVLSYLKAFSEEPAEVLQGRINQFCQSVDA